jgi:hypothetical protein
MSHVPAGVFIGASTPVASRASTITLTPPTGLIAGDSLLFFAWSGDIADSSLDIYALPVGWDVVSHIETSTGQQIVLLRREVTGSEPITHVFIESATGSGDALVGVGMAYRGFDNDFGLVSFQATDVTSSVTAFDCPSLTINDSSDLYLGFVADHAVTTTVTSPSPASQRLDFPLVSDGAHVAAFDEAFATVGPTGVRTVTLTVATTGVAVGYVLAAAPGTEATPQPGDVKFRDHGAEMLARLPEQFKAKKET